VDGQEKTSSEVAAMLGISRPHLIVIVNRHPELRPKKKVEVATLSAFLWTDDEIGAIRQYINRGKSVSTE